MCLFLEVLVLLWQAAIFLFKHMIALRIAQSVASVEGPLHLFKFSAVTRTAAGAHDALTCAGKGDGETKALVPAVQTSQPRCCRDGAADDQCLQRCRQSQRHFCFCARVQFQPWVCDRLSLFLSLSCTQARLAQWWQRPSNWVSPFSTVETAKFSGCVFFNKAFATNPIKSGLTQYRLFFPFLPENAGVSEGQEGRGLLFESPGTDADVLVSFAPFHLLAFCLIHDLCIQFHFSLLHSVLDLNAFERQNKAEGLGMVSEEGTSKSRPGVGSDGVTLNAVCPETDSQKLFESCCFSL